MSFQNFRFQICVGPRGLQVGGACGLLFRLWFCEVCMVHDAEFAVSLQLGRHWVHRVRFCCFAEA